MDEIRTMAPGAETDSAKRIQAPGAVATSARNNKIPQGFDRRSKGLQGCA